MDAEQ
jgi:hypothetical protein